MKYMQTYADPEIDIMKLDKRSESGVFYGTKGNEFEVEFGIFDREALERLVELMRKDVYITKNNGDFKRGYSLDEALQILTDEVKEKKL